MAKKRKHDLHKHIHHLTHLLYVTFCVLIIFGGIYLFNEIGKRPAGAADFMALDPTLSTGQAHILAGKAAALKVTKNDIKAVKDDKIATQSMIKTLNSIP